MGSNADTEQRWIDVWNDLLDLVRGRGDMPCQLPDGSVVTVEGCKAWLQEQAYEGHLIGVKSGWVEGRQAVIAEMFDPPDPGREAGG
jgi:hypothetical protein